LRKDSELSPMRRFHAAAVSISKKKIEDRFGLRMAPLT
jgi:hypothetical protein